MTLQEWAGRWGLPTQALTELSQLPYSQEVAIEGNSESHVQAKVRLEAARKGVYLWRNNVGAMIDKNGRPIRYGLANDSPKLNAIVKSADLVGWRKHLVTVDDVGKYVAIFTSRECKHSEWRYTDTPENAAQLRWHTMILAAGGDSAIVTGEGSL